MHPISDDVSAQEDDDGWEARLREHHPVTARSFDGEVIVGRDLLELRP